MVRCGSFFRAMVHSCCIKNCSNRQGQDKNLSFYLIPKIIKHQGKKAECMSQKRRCQWLRNINRVVWTPGPGARVCSAHFIHGKPAALFDEANPDWIPTCNLGYNLKKADTERFERALKRRRVLNEPSASGTTDVCVPEALHDSALSRQSVKPEPERDCQTDITMHSIQVLEELCLLLSTQLADLRIKVMSNPPCPSAEFLRNSSRAVKFYTGIPDWKVLSALVKFIQLAFPKMPNSHLTVFNHVVMFLMKVRLNLFDEDLACRYSIHQTSVSRTFHKVLDVSYARLSFLVKWPERDVQRETLPLSFRRFFKKCCVIIDCSEIFIEQPSDLLARAQVWSHYKHRSTLKFLIGITPQGTISYVSRCVGGRMSDKKEIVEKSSLIHHLLPGDLIIAD